MSYERSLLMLFIWCSDGSPQADLLNTMLLEYIQSPTSQLQAFRQNCGNMQASGWSSASLGGLFSTTQLSPSVGFTRLCPNRNRKQFYSHWVFLWTCAVETMTRSRFEATPEDALRHIDEAHFVPQLVATRKRTASQHMKNMQGYHRHSSLRQSSHGKVSPMDSYLKTTGNPSSVEGHSWEYG